MTTSRHPSLEQAFTPQSNRGESLAGLLAPRPRPAAAAPQTTEPEQVAPEQADEPTTRRRPRAVTAPAKPVIDAGERADVVNVAIYLPPATFAAVRAAIREQDTTYADLLVEAFATVDEDKLRARFAPRPAQPDEAGMPRRTPRARGAAGIQRQFRLNAGQRAWLQDKVTDFGAPSRSALAATVLGLHFHTLEP